MATKTQHLGRSALSLDRLSGPELLRRGIAVVEGGHALLPPTPAEEQEAVMMPRPLPSEVAGIIYALQAPPTMPVKIGFTRASELGYRVKSLQTANPYPLRVVASSPGLSAQERAAHAALASFRLTGEWFEWTPEVSAFVAALSLGIEAALATCGHCHVKADAFC